MASVSPTSAPVPATIIAELETRRRDANRMLGPCQSGCAEVDDYVLLGGFERGSVVGVSCEDERFGVTLAIQVLAHGLCTGRIGSAHVITPRPQNEILTAMRDGIVTELKASGWDGDARARARVHLERVMLSCVFDMEGVWEVVAGLDRQPSPKTPSPKEIKDSQDEDDEDEAIATEERPGPDVVVITHFGSLMTGLFTHRSSSSAHETAQLLSSHLRHLSRSMASSPLILLLNSTASSTSTAATAAGDTDSGLRSSSSKNKPLDPTLRSIFNPPFLSGYGQTTHPMGAQAATALSRRNKPTFGLIFSNFLDLHVLCTRVPRTDADADIAFGVEPAAGGDAEYATVVEVLLDEMGVWPAVTERSKTGEGSTRIGQERKYREQRWGAVMIKDGRIVNAFEKQKTSANTSDIRLAAGFGGPRV